MLCGALSKAERLHSWSKLKLGKLSVPELVGSFGEERKVLAINARGEGEVSCRSSGD